MKVPEDVDDFSTKGWPILPQDLLGKISRGKASTDIEDISFSSESKQFHSTGEQPKKIAFDQEDLQELAENFGNTYAEAGVTDEHTVLNLGAAKETNHMSQWSIENGIPEIGNGGKVLNESKEDFLEYRNQWDEVDVLVSLPRAMKSLGEMIRNEYGKEPREMFPEAELVVTSGDVMPDSLREDIEEMYDVDVVSFYAGTEPGPVATEVEPGIYKPSNDNLKLEILDKNAEMLTSPSSKNPGETHQFSEDDIYDLKELDEGEIVTGSILITDLRNELPMVRVQNGDEWTAKMTGDGARMVYEGRKDNVINFAGAMLYPEEIDEAVHDKVETPDWKAVISEDNDYVKLDLFLPETDNIEDVDWVEKLSKYNGSIDAWYDAGSMQINGKTYGSKEELEELLQSYDLEKDLLPDQFKSKRIAFDSSYRPTGK